ncbi:hypothetical protein K438DRAFT_1770816 [Mycena galopus ATCC 62051]|nr:hypothetical protein K438DRAFT_1770816 [Mycena galopus ATCC 62051]
MGAGVDSASTTTHPHVTKLQGEARILHQAICDAVLDSFIEEAATMVGMVASVACWNTCITLNCCCAAWNYLSTRSTANSDAVQAEMFLKIEVHATQLGYLDPLLALMDGKVEGRTQLPPPGLLSHASRPSSPPRVSESSSATLPRLTPAP